MRGSIHWLPVLLAGYALIHCMANAGAAYPDRPIHMIVGPAPGGVVDFMARTIAQKLSEKLGQPVLVENRSGADGSIAINYAAHAAPDGYTLAFVASADAVTPLEIKVNYDFVKDFTPVINAGYTPEMILVNPSAVSAASIREFIAYAKANPGKLSYGTSGAGGIEALELQLFSKEAGVQMVDVPYKGASPALTALVGGEVQMTMMSFSTASEQVKAGKGRALLVTGPKRLPGLPDVPTVAEVGGLPLLDGVSHGGVWHGVSVPAGTPREIVNKLNNEIADILKDADIQQRFDARSVVVIENSPEDFARLISEDVAKWTSVLNLLGITPVEKK